MIRLLLCLCLALPLLAPRGAGAHALEPGYLELVPLGGAEWRVAWRVPQVGGQPMPIVARLPGACAPREGDAGVFDGRAFVTGWVATCEDGLAGGEIRIEGLEATQTDVLVRYALDPEGRPQAERLTPQRPAFVIPPPRGTLALAGSYVSLGVDHILKGIDHLLFVFALLLLIRDGRRLLWAVTAFTLAHSLSLAAASLGWIVVPAPPVEAVVALSIMVLAAELVHPEGRGLRLTERYPWSVAFAFGLLHGLGFARALLDIGLPEGEVPLALFSFNVGVELGQVMFIALVLLTGSLLFRLYPRLSERMLLPGSAGRLAMAYSIGTLSAYWVVQRVAGFVA
jgi:hydrogenase/urease accessory protein HupE